MNDALTSIPFNRIDGTAATLSEFGGVLLVVNVASKCGLAGQYEGLQSLFSGRAADGLTVIGFPSNDFMGQEPGTNEEIAEFCSVNYAVTFPMMEKISVVGDNQHPLYAALVRAQPTADGKEEMRRGIRATGDRPTEDPDVLWNFEKFVIGRDGKVVGRFAPTVGPEDPALVEAIDAALASK